MNGLIWILLLCCCGQNNGCGCSNNKCESAVEDRRRGDEYERNSCSLKERDAVWTPYTSNSSERDNDCGCEHKH